MSAVLVPYTNNYNSENTPALALSHFNGRRLSTQIRKASLHQAARRRRARVHAVTDNLKFNIDHAKKKRQVKAPLVSFKVSAKAPPPPPSTDIEMTDASAPVPPAPQPQPAAVSKQPIHTPRYLVRPPPRQISPQAIKAAAPDLVDVNVDYIKDALPELGVKYSQLYLLEKYPDSSYLRMLHTLTKVQITPPENKGFLPKELVIVMNDGAFDIPSHLFAVYGQTKRGPGQIKLFPIHGIVFGLNCVYLPALPPVVEPVSPPEDGPIKVSIPVVPLRLPSPQVFARLMEYLYLKQASVLLGPPFLPVAIPPRSPLDSDRSAANILSFAKTLPDKYSARVLMEHTAATHGLWQNVVTLGIFDEGLWDAMDLIWEILLIALAIATGDPDCIIPQDLKSPSMDTDDEEEDDSAASPTSG
jgi:hypothetical protein